MKKSLALLLILTLAFTFIACNKAPEEPVDENPQGLKFYMKDDGTYVVECGDAKYRSNIVIPATYKGGAVVGIGNEAFANCTSLESITIPDAVTSIGDSAFSGCTSLTSITIPTTVTSIGYSAFSGCTSLTSITIPATVTSIGFLTFSNCSALTSITIPDSVTSIGFYAFDGCTSLTTVYFDGTKEQWRAVDKGYDWNGTSLSYIPAKQVICSDGKEWIS